MSSIDSVLEHLDDVAHYLRPTMKNRSSGADTSGLLLASLCMRGVEGPCRQEIAEKIPSLLADITWAASPRNAADRHDSMRCPPFGFVFFHPNIDAPLPYAAPLPAVPTLRSSVKLYAVLSYTTGMSTESLWEARGHLHRAFAEIGDETWERVIHAWRVHREAAYGEEGRDAVEQMRFRASCFRIGGTWL